MLLMNGNLNSKNCLHKKTITTSITCRVISTTAKKNTNSLLLMN